MNVEAMNTKKRNMLAKIFPNFLTVIDIHEFTGYEPATESIVRQPIMGMQHKVTVKTGKPVQFESQMFSNQPL